MAQVYKHLEPFEKRAIDFFRQRIDEIKEQQGNLVLEESLLEEVVRRLGPCPDCNGQGKTRNVIDQDWSEYERCGSCKGTGVRGHGPDASTGG